MSTTPPEPETGPYAAAERRRLINVAYRLLGSLTDAEDVVQETYARWYAMPEPRRRAIESPPAWRSKVASRICLDLLGSARFRRESYVGAWVPEPLPDRTELADDPADQVTLDESISMAFLVVLEAMTPAERVAFILHDVFRYPYAEIAEVVGRTPAACRQLASSARLRLRASHAPAGPAAGDAEVVAGFKRAWEAKDIDALVGLLAPGATATGDGGGAVKAALHPVTGAERVARFFVDRAVAQPALTIAESTVNGRPGLVTRLRGRTVSVMAFDVADGRIEHIWAVLNPDKLGPWTRAADARKP